MASQVQTNFRIRNTFAKINSLIDIPDLIEIQKRSYSKFLQLGMEPDKRQDTGLQAVFSSVFPIKDFNETASLDFVKYEVDPPKYDVEECIQRGMTYAAPMRVSIRLIVWEKDEVTGQQSIRSVKEQDVYFGEIPLMTENGTFIVNGTERVIVSQLHRSPGAFFFVNQDKTKAAGAAKLIHSARIIPNRGSWLDFEFDTKDILHVRIDRRRKMPCTILLKALGYSAKELLDYFYDTQSIYMTGKGKFEKSVNIDLLLGQRATRDLRNPETREIIVRKNRKFTRGAIRQIQKLNITRISIDQEELLGSVSAEDLINEDTGEVVLQANETITEEVMEKLWQDGVREFKILFIDGLNVGPYLRDTLLVDKVETEEEAILEIYRRLRPGDPPTVDTSTTLFNNLFFNPERYDLSKVGRLKLNHKFGLDEPLTNTILTKRDILEVVRYLLDLKNGKGQVDDIDHLGNRRVRAVGELLENQFRVGLVRMERAIRERMSLQEIETLMPHDLISPKPVAAVIKEFFGSSQLSQFMDQTNPLSEITHKRRLSALGPGGLTRERAGFEVRDVHPTHYGRICPIETPEGPNIGLISSLATYARVNEYGFVETPYRKVEGGKVVDQIDFYSALQEEAHVIAQANALLNENGEFTEPLVASRRGGEAIMSRPEDITLMDVSPKQLVSVATSLIPFLENDDANRALMGSNMQRQAVPLLRSHAPLVGTGMEEAVARDSGVTVIAKRSGVVDSVEATRIVVKADTAATSTDVAQEVDIYNLVKFQRSNQSTCLNQKPIVRRGERVQAGDTIADGPATDRGELALGQNLVVAFMPWGGYNFEDSILISERVRKEDLYTSIHIEEFECVARDTKLGKEEITRDIPNVGEEALRNLDDAGIVRVGAEVGPGDILVGKITPKGETQLSPEEKLLRAIFGEKAGDVRDTSLRVGPGTTGTVIGAKVFARKGIDKDVRAQAIEEEEEAKLLKDQNDEIKIIKESARRKIHSLLKDKTTTNRLVDDDGEVVVAKGDALSEAVLSSLREKYFYDIRIGDDEVEEQVEAILESVEEQVALAKMKINEKIARLKKGDELPPGVIKMVKVYMAIKRKLNVGDKMAGRHGNKGVISRILPVEDMPYLEDGTPVDIVLNPLGVPSRMNVGQILETHLGWGAKGIGRQLDDFLAKNYSAEQLRPRIMECLNSEKHKAFVEKLKDKDIVRMAKALSQQGLHMATPVFEAASEGEIREILEGVKLPTSGQMVLFDGRSGDPFDQEVTVGVMYMLKLHHLVDDKIHARSIGPYSLVTQQPLGGKAQFGGQRFGEMEVWAMEAYGAAYALQEFLTVKSDDVQGRTRMYEAIVKGENVLECGLPESFKVLTKELQALCLDLEMLDEGQDSEGTLLPPL